MMAQTYLDDLRAYISLLHQPSFEEVNNLPLLINLYNNYNSIYHNPQPQYLISMKEMIPGHRAGIRSELLAD